ncbi:hypothetical protein GGQ68_004809 [Sagittula marina]|uniref:Polysaccharide biosynthesis protein n=1 Tax=Sagittula marina TaxID=943940 RepID=A0A7W6DWW4_9RHOB|nr:hypothetical protein [Sagittula marina]MBB3988452.1 hypothetical protein [Sagittula marina]
MFRVKPLVASIVAVQVASFVANLSFVTFLPDMAMVTVVAVMSLFGVISAGVSSNITAKIYSHTAAGDDPSQLARMALRLLLMEQVAAVAVALFLPLLGLEALKEVATWQLFLLALLASNASTLAFTKYRNRYLLRLNLVRATVTITRAAVIHAVAALGAAQLIIPIIIMSLVPTFGYPLLVALRQACTVTSAKMPVPLGVSLREYLLGIPVSVIRSITNQGMVILAVEVLSPQDLRLFRFLLLPKDIFNRLFNAALPIVFDKLYLYRLDRRVTLGIMCGSAVIGALWFWIGLETIGGTWQPVGVFVVFLALNATVYSVLPIMWRTVHRNRAGLNIIATLATAGLTLVTYLLVRPQGLQGLFGLMSVYYLSYILAMLVIYRLETREEGRQ